LGKLCLFLVMYRSQSGSFLDVSANPHRNFPLYLKHILPFCFLWMKSSHLYIGCYKDYCPSMDFILWLFPHFASERIYSIPRVLHL
jgi:hypothetical protein